MSSNIAVAVAVIGLLVFFVGIAMPATQTKTATTCTEPGLYGGCVESTYEAPNTAKGPTIFLGLALTIIGFVSAIRDKGSSSRQTTSTYDTEWNDTKTSSQERERRDD